VVADAVNGVAAARAGWVAQPARTGAALRFVEVRCSDVAEHRRRVEAREPEMPGQGAPTWEQVLRRRYEPWARHPVLQAHFGAVPDQMIGGIPRPLAPLLLTLVR
jgi:hypothetical protein